MTDNEAIVHAGVATHAESPILSSVITADVAGGLPAHLIAEAY